MDHEFGTSFLEPEQQGWDWLSMQLDDGRELMLYQLRRADGSRDPRSSGTLVDAQGRTTHLSAGDFTLTGRAHVPGAVGRTSTRWRGRWRFLAADHARRDDTAREPGTGDDRGRHHLLGGANRRPRHGRGGQPANGRGYLEMTGYKGSLGRVLSGR